MDPISRDLAIVLRQLRAAFAPCALVALPAALLSGCAEPRDLGTRRAALEDEVVSDCLPSHPLYPWCLDDGGHVDLVIQKQHLGPFVAGQTGVFELGVSNLGSAAASPVVVTDVLDPAFTFVSAGPNPPWSCTATPTPPQTVTCTFTGGPIPAMTSMLPIHLTVQIGDHLGPIDNCATVGTGDRGFLDVDPRNDTSCDTVEVTDDAATCPPLDHNLSSGVNDQTQAAIPAGRRDDTWRIISSPVFVGAPFIATLWPWPGSGWMTPVVNPSSSTQASDTPPAGHYVYETCFCLSSDASDQRLDLTLLADNWIAGVQLNGCPLFTGAAGRFDGAPLHVQTTDAACFKPGENCVQVDVWNNEIYTGLKVDGSVSATNDGTCCPSSCP